MIRLTCSARDLSRLIHAKRVRIDPAFRGELIRLFDNPKARMAYFSKHGLSVDELGEAIWDAGLCHERPTFDGSSASRFAETLPELERAATFWSAQSSFSQFNGSGSGTAQSRASGPVIFEFPKENS